MRGGWGLHQKGELGYGSQLARVFEQDAEKVGQR